MIEEKKEIREIRRERGMGGEIWVDYRVRRELVI
jgi:hypothetical protein